MGFMVSMRESVVPRMANPSLATVATPQSAGRVIDLAVALAALIFVGLALVLVAALVALEGTGPIFFSHTRVGFGGQRFKVLKFRSMRVDGDRILAEHLRDDPEAAEEWARDHKLRNDPRVTPLGRFLRKSSLDELPQLINVVRGEMSVVGPRPIVEAEICKYGRFYAAYCSVRPGITGLWQVSGRNDVSYRRRVAMDTLYAKRKSVALDLRLMVATIPAVLARRGSY
jgi:exopolysaccharide production protein ExoY